MQPIRFSVPSVVFLTIFVLSGFAGLIYESIWSHYLKLFLGHAAYAQALVLMIFMGGMAGGAALAARYSLRIKHALLGYALVELLIGLSALVFHGLFNDATNWAYDSVLPNLGSPVAIETFKWALAAMLILPQSLLLGSTFPLMSAGLVRRAPDRAGYNLSMLYFTNSLGAATGVLVSGFVLIEWVGLPGALLTAGLVNVALAAFVWVLLKTDDQERHVPDVPSVYSQISTKQGSSQLVWLLLMATFISSAASFFYEIGWIRMLSLVLGSATHSFELMLSSFILGLAIGGFLIRRKIDHFKRPLYVLATIQIVMGLLAALTIPLYTSTFDVMAWVIDALNRSENGFALFTGAKHVIAMIIMLPATILAGMTLPIVTHALLKAGQGEQAIGKVYAINTVGAIAGVVLASLLIMPALGLRSVIMLGALGDIVVGITLLWFLRKEQGMVAGSTGVMSMRTYALVGAALASWIGIMLFSPFNLGVMASGVYRVGALGIKASSVRSLIDHFDGATATVSTYYSDNNKASVSIATNGKPDASMSTTEIPTSDELTQAAVAWVPLAVHANAKEIAIIGFGSGYTANVLLGDPDLTRVDVIEIEPKMVEGARNAFGDRLPRVFNDPRSHIYINDAKTFFSSQKSQYDVIIGEPSNPWVSGVSSLFTQEFYKRVKRYLKPEGIYVQWLQGYEISLPLVSTVFAALISEFSDVQIYALGNSDFLLLAKPDGHIEPLSERPFKAAGVAESLSRMGITSLSALELRRGAGKATLQELVQALESKPNSDYFPLLDLGAEKTRFMSANVSELQRFRTIAFLLTETLDGFSPLVDLTVSKNDFSPIAGGVRLGLGFSSALNQWASTGEPIVMDKEDLDLISQRRLNGLLSTESCNERIADLWLADVQYVIHSAMPYVGVHALDAPINRLMTHPCSTKQPYITNWLRFYKAMNNRDYETMLVEGYKLLQSADVSEENKRWLAFNVAIAALVMKDYPKMKSIWSPYAGKHSDVEIERKILDLVLAKAIIKNNVKQNTPSVMRPAEK